MPQKLQNPSIRQDMVFWRRLRQPDFQVLVDIKESEIQSIAADKGSVITPCADGDQIFELLSHHRKVLHSSNCHHTPALNGGPLLYSDSPDLDNEMQRDGEVLLRHSFEGRNMKGVETFICYGHAPCGKALANNIRADELAGHYLRAKDHVRRHATTHGIPLAAVGLWIHIEWPDSKKKTYVFKRKAWMTPEVTDFRMQWRDPDFRQKMTAEYWDTYWPQLAAA